MLGSFNDVPARDRIIVALDCPADQAMRLADQLSGRAKWLKIGMTLYYACGPTIIHAMKKLGFNVFLDLKLHDIPNTVRKSMSVLGGKQMWVAGQEGVAEVCQSEGRENTITLGITVLTSMDNEALAQVGISRTAAEQVDLLANVAKESGISGVVASPQEASMLRKILGPDAYIVTPGVRPKGSDKGDQSRIATPAEAFAAGASHIVIGRPITQADDPAAAFDAIAAELDAL